LNRHDFLWINWKNTATTELPWFTELDQDFSFGQSVHRWKKHLSRCIENQLDYAHLPFVHGNTIGRGFNLQAHREFTQTERGLKLQLGEGEIQFETYFEYRFPNVWILNLSQKFKNTLAFVPVNDHETLIYQRAYHQITRIPILRNMVSWVLKISNIFILGQDHSVVMGQIPGNVLNASEEQLFPSDRLIRRFREWLAQAK
jgi:phenylpropionate dioxygenase-like ring-hydroxylating dioxygenase large terminal subunit